MRRIRKGDIVRVLSGRDKGKEGKVLAVLSDPLRVLVEGVNVKKKHVKANPQLQKPGGIIPKEMPMPACKVALIDPTTGKTSRVGIKVLEDGQKVRVFKASGEVIDG